MKKNIGLFGGSFNPVHNGHINVAVEFTEKFGLDEVWFIPAKVSPHKSGQSIVSLEHRLAMLTLALQPFPSFFVKNLEGDRPPPSYTIDTLKSVIESDSLNHYYLIIGSDTIEKFMTWKNPEEIVSLARILLASRTPDVALLNPVKDYPLIYESFEKGYTRIRVMEISSTDIRQRFKEKLTCNHMMCQKVIDYIYGNKLY